MGDLSRFGFAVLAFYFVLSTIFFGTGYLVDWAHDTPWLPISLFGGLLPAFWVALWVWEWMEWDGPFASGVGGVIGLTVGVAAAVFATAAALAALVFTAMLIALGFFAVLALGALFSD